MRRQRVGRGQVGRTAKLSRQMRYGMAAALLLLGSCRAPTEAEAPRPSASKPKVAERAVATGSRGHPLGVRLSEVARGTLPSAPQVTPLSDAEAARVLAKLPDLPPAPAPSSFVPVSSVAPPPPPTGKAVSFLPKRTAAPAPPSASAAPAALTVLHRSPVGDAWAAPLLSVTFSGPMVPLGRHADLSGKALPIELTPEPPGRWRWLGTHTAVFEPEERFPMATEYAVRVRAGARALTGALLAQPLEWSFRMPAPTLLQSYPMDGQDLVELTPSIRLLFDQRIDQAKLLPFVKARAGGKPVALRLATEAERALGDDSTNPLRPSTREPQSQARDQLLVVRPQAPLPKDTDIEVVVEAGAPSGEGPERTPEPQRVHFRTHGPLKLVREPCQPDRPCQPGRALSFGFNNPLDLMSFEEAFVSVSPPIEDMAVQVYAEGFASGSLVEIGGNIQGGTPYTVTFAGELQDAFGQKLGNPVARRVTVGAAQPRLTWDAREMLVLDPGLRPELSFQSVNQPEVTLLVYRVRPEDWPAYLEYQSQRRIPGKQSSPPGTLLATETLRPAALPDQRVTTRVPLGAYLDEGLGQLVIELRGNQAARRWRMRTPADAGFNYGDHDYLLTWVQSTKMALHALTAGDFAHVWASELATGAPLSGVALDLLQGTAGKAKTEADGMAKLPLPKRGAKQPRAASLIIARSGKDIALLPSSRHTSLALHERHDELRWLVLDDRGIYRPGERVRVKGWLRRRAAGPKGDLDYPAPPRGFRFVVKSRRGHELATGRSTIGRAGEFDVSFLLPDDADLGQATLYFQLPGARQDGAHAHAFRVAEYVAPEHEVELTTSGAPHLVGEHAVATANARYYAGGPLPAAKTSWQVSVSPAAFTPPNRGDFEFGWSWRGTEGDAVESSGKLKPWVGRTDADGRHRLRLDFEPTASAYPKRVSLEASIQDIDTKTVAATTELVVHPANVTVGMQRAGAYVRRGDDIDLTLLVTDLDGHPVAGREVTVVARRIEQDVLGHYADPETPPSEVCRFESLNQPTTCSAKPQRSGLYELTAEVIDASGRASRTTTHVFVAGAGASLGPPHRDAEVELLPSKRQYAAGETAELLVLAPFAPAEALLSVQRDGIVELRRFRLEQRQSVIRVEIQPEQLPQLVVGLDLVGQQTRRRSDGTPDPSLPPVPAFASGTARLQVSADHRRLDVELRPEQAEAAPGEPLGLNIEVRAPDGSAAKHARVALIVVDEAVLDLLEQHPADPLLTMYPHVHPGVEGFGLRRFVPLEEQRKAQARARPKPKMSKERRAKLLELSGSATLTSATPVSPPTTVRNDLRALAAFVPEIETDAGGRARTNIQLPQSLTRFRAIAVATSGPRMFGRGETTLTTRLPIALRPAPPRFLNHGDRFTLAVAVQNPTSAPAEVEVAARARNARLLGPTGVRLWVPARDRREAHFSAATEALGTARIQIGAASSAGSDATEVEIPVHPPATTESFATYGELDEGSLASQLDLPDGVVPEYGGLEVRTASTALHGASEAVTSLLQSPYPTNELSASRVLALSALSANDALDVVAELPEPELRRKVQREVDELIARQHAGGGWAYLQHASRDSSPWVSVHATHALLRAQQAGFAVPPAPLERALLYLARLNPPGHAPAARIAALAYSAYVQELAGRPKVLQKAKLIVSEAGGTDALGLEALGWLLPVFAADAGGREQVAEIERLLDNAASQTADKAHFAIPYQEHGHLLLRSEHRADAAILGALLSARPTHPLVAKLARGLSARSRAAWQLHPDSALAVLFLSQYVAQFEKTEPRFMARTWIGSTLAAEHGFFGRKSAARHTQVPLSYLLDLNDPIVDLVVDKQGAGRLYYRLGLSYALAEVSPPAQEQGFSLLRTYEAVDDPSDVRRTEDGGYHIKRGARVRSHVYVFAPAERHHVAVVDPLPAGLEAVDSALATTPSLPEPQFHENPRMFGEERLSLPAAERRRMQRLKELRQIAAHRWYEHLNLRDEKVEAFASLLPAGVYVLRTVCRATTPGTFVAPPPKALEIHDPETFGRDVATRVVIH